MRNAKMKIEINYNENDISEIYGTIEKLKEIISKLEEELEKE